MTKGLKVVLWLMVIILILALGVGVGWYFKLYEYVFPSAENSNQTNTNMVTNTNEVIEEVGIESFASAEEYEAYVEAGSEYEGLTVSMNVADMGEQMATKEAGEDLSSSSRYSSTNVQVQGIDEPDIIKTDGKNIYYYPSDIYHYYDPMSVIDMKEEVKSSADEGNANAVSLEEKEMTIEEELLTTPDVSTKEIAAPDRNPATYAVSAYPPEKMDVASEIANYGELLLNQNNLLIFGTAKIYAFDVSDPATPKKTWTLEYADNAILQDARLMDGQLYLVMRTDVSNFSQCPYDLLSVGKETLSVKCENIYHPTITVPADVTYNVVKVDMATGEAEADTSFVGSSGSSVVYMAEENIYISYSYPGDLLSLVYDFMQENSGLFPASLVEKISKVRSYDLSEPAKYTELYTILEEYGRSLSKDEKLKFENETQDRATEFAKEHSRDFASTGIVKIATSDLMPVANGTIPGVVLNQFSLDEYNGYLRIASTSDGSFFGLGMSTGTEILSLNDVYVLDGELRQVGAVKDLGLEERIYSARFIGERGYVVTFRETDPFYVLDLTDPKSPQLAGELKIPGYSSYLHPLKENLILGVGEENGQVKLSLFDVASAAKPQEVDKYNMKDYWTDVEKNHHAFLQDADNSLFFMPGSDGGYVFSYQGDKLKMEKAIAGIEAKRAVYIDNYLYVAGAKEIKVYDEKTWEEVVALELKQ